jgi:sugar/nucleoside kinase (ribokinase family)
MNLGLKSRKGFITGGTWCVDHNKLVKDWPKEEEVVEIIEEHIRGGGSACNLAFDLKRLDPSLPVSTIGLVGEDEDGRHLFQQALEVGLETKLLLTTTIVKTQKNRCVYCKQLRATYPFIFCRDCRVSNS